MSISAGDTRTIFSDDEIEILMVRVEGGTQMRLMFRPSGVAAMGSPSEHEDLLMRVKTLTLLQLLDLKPDLVRRYPELGRWCRELRTDDGQAAVLNLANGLTDRTYLSLIYLLRRGKLPAKEAAAGNYRLMSDPMGRALIEGRLEGLLNETE